MNYLAINDYLVAIMIHFSHSSRNTPLSEIRERQKQLATEWCGELPDLFALPKNFELIAKKNCENLIGAIEIPVGIAGPVQLEIDGKMVEFLIPLATSEGALVASVHRGCKLLRSSSSVSVQLKKIGMTRAPVFRCRDGKTAYQFQEWLINHEAEIATRCETTSQHLKWNGMKSWIRGRHLYVRCVFDTDEAMGMNMVTIALDKAFQDISQRFPGVKLLALSSNVCTDKKDSLINSLLGRGYWVQAEAQISSSSIAEILHASPTDMVNIHVQKNLIGSNIAGSTAQNAHLANIVAALFLATGQDAAHIVSSSQGYTTVETGDQGLYCSVTLPTVEVGTVGGGSWLPKQTQARRVIHKDHATTGKELSAALAIACLAGELSLLGSLAEGSLAQAHQELGRIQP